MMGGLTRVPTGFRFIFKGFSTPRPYSPQIYRQCASLATNATTASSSTFITRAPLYTAFSDLLKLSKHRLSALVAFTAAAGYVCRAEDPTLSTQLQLQCSSDVSGTYDESNIQTEDSSLSGHVFSLRTLAATTAGTLLTAASANTLNQVYERFSDTLMKRTAQRPLPSGRVGLLSALAFAGATAFSGLTLLHFETNSTTTMLAASNIALYAAVYTPLKRLSPFNTWLGAVVGALPPLLGWAAASDGHLLERRERPAWLFASLLFLWQIPHFHALAVALRSDYARAQLRMLAVSNPIANARWAAITAAALVPLGFFFHSEGVVTEAFAWESALLSFVMFSSATSLVANPTCPIAARALFRASIFHLPISLVLLLAQRIPYPHFDRPSQLSSVRKQTTQEIYFHQPWEVIAPFPFLPVPRGAPAIVLELNEDRLNQKGSSYQTS